MQFHLTFTPAAEDTDGLADDATGAAAFTLLSSGPGDGLAHQVSLSSSANLSAINFTIVGTDADGGALTETRAGPNNNTVETAAYFKTVTSITPASTMGASTCDAGWVDEFVTPTIGINHYRSETSIRVVKTGTINWTARQTFNALRGASSSTLDWSDSTDSDMVAATASQLSVLDKPVTAIQLQANSYSAGAALDLDVVQADS